MLNTSARLLRLLSLLQLPANWTGSSLADRLSVSSRTVRADIERLRSLGYPVDAVPGPGGGYRLGVGAVLPPLLFDDDEALAVALALRIAAGGVVGYAEGALRALAKMQQVLPSRLQHRLETVLAAVDTPTAPAGNVDPEGLTAIAQAIRAHERLRFDYVGHHGGEPVLRLAEPYRLVHAYNRWYLAGWDDDRRAWRTFRLDRIRLRTPNGARFRPRPEPAGGFAVLVEHAVGAGTWRYQVQAVVAAPATRIIARVPPAVVVEAIDDYHCTAHVGSDDPGQLVLWLGLMDADFTVTAAPELAEPLRRLSERYARAADSTQGPSARRTADGTMKG